MTKEKTWRVDVQVDGVDIPEPERFRFASSECFDMNAMVPAHQNAKPLYPTASDGYWMMLKPLPPGKHTVAFRGIYGALIQNIKYDLTVL